MELMRASTKGRATVGSVGIVNIGRIVTGDFHQPVDSSESILIEDGIIRRIGTETETGAAKADHVVDANTTVICPGLIDPHLHMAIGDWTPICKAQDWMETALWVGVTTMISEGEDQPGFPRFYDDRVGVKATVLLANRSYRNARPGGGMKVESGALVLVNGLTEGDFKELADEGIWLIAEIGGGGLCQPSEIRDMIAWANKYNYFISMHCGGASIPGSSPISAEEIIEVGPRKVAHINGGSTAPPKRVIDTLISQTEDTYFEIIHHGNMKMMTYVLDVARECNKLDKIVIGSDCPTGIGMETCAIHRTLINVASFCDVPGAQAIAMATGNTADCYRRLNRGKVQVGMEADLLAIDKTPGSLGNDVLESIEIGDTFGVSMVMVDGRIFSVRGRDGRPSEHYIKVDGRDLFLSDVNDYIFGPNNMPYL
jgi:enamidase